MQRDYPQHTEQEEKIRFIANLLDPTKKEIKTDLFTVHNALYTQLAIFQQLKKSLSNKLFTASLMVELETLEKTAEKDEKKGNKSLQTAMDKVHHHSPSSTARHTPSTTNQEEFSKSKHELSNAIGRQTLSANMVRLFIQVLKNTLRQHYDVYSLSQLPDEKSFSNLLEKEEAYILVTPSNSSNQSLYLFYFNKIETVYHELEIHDNVTCHKALSDCVTDKSGKIILGFTNEYWEIIAKNKKHSWNDLIKKHLPFNKTAIKKEIADIEDTLETLQKQIDLFSRFYLLFNTDITKIFKYQALRQDEELDQVALQSTIDQTQAQIDTLEMLLVTLQTKKTQAKPENCTHITKEIEDVTKQLQKLRLKKTKSELQLNTLSDDNRKKQFEQLQSEYESCVKHILTNYPSRDEQKELMELVNNYKMHNTKVERIIPLSTEKNNIHSDEEKTPVTTRRERKPSSRTLFSKSNGEKTSTNDSVFRKKSNSSDRPLIKTKRASTSSTNEAASARQDAAISPPTKAIKVSSQTIHSRSNPLPIIKKHNSGSIALSPKRNSNQDDYDDEIETPPSLQAEKKLLSHSMPPSSSTINLSPPSDTLRETTTQETDADDDSHQKQQHRKRRMTGSPLSLAHCRLSIFSKDDLQTREKEEQNNNEKEKHNSHRLSSSTKKDD